MDNDDDILDNLLEEEEEEEDEESNKKKNINEDKKNEEEIKESIKEEEVDESIKNLPLLHDILENKANPEVNINNEDNENNSNESIKESIKSSGSNKSKEEKINNDNNINNNTNNINNNNNLNLNNLYPQVTKKDNTTSMKIDIKEKNQTSNNNKVETPYQSLEERTFLTEQLNPNPNKLIKNNNIIKNEIKEEESVSTEKKEEKKIKYIKFKRVKESKLEKKINEILKRSNKLGNNFDKVEEAYNELKKPLEELLSKPETKDEVEIIRQNAKILIFFDLLNKILSLVADNPIPIFKKKNPVVKNKNKDINELMKEEKEKIELNNKKIISNYEKEIINMKKKVDKIRDENYENNLDKSLELEREQIFVTEKKIAELKLKIKQREIEQDRENKKNTKEIKLKNLICDYKIKRKERALLSEKIIKAQNHLTSLNDLKIKCQKKLEDKISNAKDLYGINEIKSVKEINYLKNKYKKEEMNLIKINDIENATKHKKRAYEKLIESCKREIKLLKEQKKNLEEEIKKEEIIQNNIQKRIKGFFGNKNIFETNENIIDKNINIKKKK